MFKVYIANIKSDVLKTYPETNSSVILHKLICDRKTEGARKIERGVTSVLSMAEYQSVCDNGYYIVND